MNLEVCNTNILSDIPGAQVIRVGHSEVIYVPTWLPDPDEWFELLKTLPWTAEEIMMYGRELCLRRQTVNYGDHYNYNPKAKPALPWTTSRPVMELKSRLEHATGGIYTQCACNRYSDGSVIIGVHRDKRDPILIASISFGAERQMGFCARGEKQIDRSLPLVTLASGSLLLFDGEFNRSYKHGIVPDKSVKGERISVTFRQFEDEPEF
jgi:alkylated DNA repair dioxygenase AlkB